MKPNRRNIANVNLAHGDVQDIQMALANNADSYKKAGSMAAYMPVDMLKRTRRRNKQLAKRFQAILELLEQLDEATDAG